MQVEKKSCAGNWQYLTQDSFIDSMLRNPSIEVPGRLGWLIDIASLKNHRGGCLP
jgi:hypothetical protein